MKLFEIKQLIQPNISDNQASEMTTPNVYDVKNRGIGAKTTAKREKVTVKDSKTGKIYGRRTVVQ